MNARSPLELLMGPRPLIRFAVDVSVLSILAASTTWASVQPNIPPRLKWHDNSTYCVEASQDLGSAQWTKVGNSMAGTSGTITYTETRTQSAPRRFLRVGVTLP